MVILGRQSNFTIEVMDTNLASFNIINGEVEGAELIRESSDSSVYIFIWTPTSIDRPIVFLATDAMNASSQYEPRIEICRCLNGGRCTLDGILDQTVNPIDLNCDCSSGKCH